MSSSQKPRLIPVTRNWPNNKKLRIGIPSHTPLCFHLPFEQIALFAFCKKVMVKLIFQKISCDSTAICASHVRPYHTKCNVVCGMCDSIGIHTPRFHHYQSFYTVLLRNANFTMCFDSAIAFVSVFTTVLAVKSHTLDHIPPLQGPPVLQVSLKCVAGVSRVCRGCGAFAPRYLLYN